MENNSTNNKENLKSRILFIAAVIVLIAGIIGVLTRGDSVDKLIGTVFVVTDENSSEIEGYKIRKQYEEDIKEYDIPSVDAIKQECKAFAQNDNSNIAVSFTGHYIGDVFYSVYKFSDNTPVYENRTSLTVPVGESEGYLVKVEITWGKRKNNVIVDYYFNIN